MTGAPAQFPVEALERDVAALFTAAGLPASAAEIVAHDLVAADVEGVASHGVMLVPMYLDRIRSGSVSLATKGEITSSKAGTAVIDAGNMLGQLTARQAVTEAVIRAKEYGLGAVAVRNAFHLGALAPYARLMADQGCFGVVTTNTRPLLPATGGAAPLTGNNPIALAAPSSGPFHAEVDMALSAVAMGKIRNAANAGHDIPDGWATDADGQPTTDPSAAIAGMLLPAAGPKGFGLAFLLDLLAGGMSNGGIGPDVRGLYGDPSVPYGCAAFFLAIDVEHFTDAGAFGERSREALERASASKTAPGVKRVFAPGELAASARKSSQGKCTVAPTALKALAAAGKSLNVEFSSIEFAESA